MRVQCFECTVVVEEDDLKSVGEKFLEHARANHEWPYPDQAVRNYAEATQRLTGDSERLEVVENIEIHPVTSDRIDDWQRFFDHEAFVGTPEWAACYCLEPHVRDPNAKADDDVPHWRDNREAMKGLLGDGDAFGYLAYVDGHPAGWVNASKRISYSLYKSVDPGGPDPSDVIGVSCFIISPPYRRHGVAASLLDRVLSDASERGAHWVEAYPFNESGDADNGNFRGPRSMYEARGFETVEIRGRDTVMRRPASVD